MFTQSSMLPYWSPIMKIPSPIKPSLLHLLSSLAKRLNMKLKKSSTSRPPVGSLCTSSSEKAILYLTAHGNLLRTWNIPSISHGPSMKNTSSNLPLRLLLLLLSLPPQPIQNATVVPNSPTLPPLTFSLWRISLGYLSIYIMYLISCICIGISHRIILILDLMYW